MADHNQVSSLVALNALKSAEVTLSAVTRLREVPKLAQALAQVDHSAVVRIRGSEEQIRSAISHLGKSSRIVSAAVGLRGDKPVGG